MPTVVATIPASDIFSSSLAEFKQPQMMVARKTTARGGPRPSSLAGVSGYPGDAAMQIAPEYMPEHQVCKEEFSTTFLKHGKRRRSPTGETLLHTDEKKVTDAEGAKDKECSSSQDASHPLYRVPESKGVDCRLKRCDVPKAERSVSGYEGGGAWTSDHRVGDMEGTSGVHENVRDELRLQWGQRKRLRFARTDARVGADEVERDGKKRRSGIVAPVDQRPSSTLYTEETRQRISSGPLPSKEALGLSRSQKKDGHGKRKNEGRPKNSPPFRQPAQASSHEDDPPAATDDLRQSHSPNWAANSPERGNGGALEAGLLQERRYIQQCLVNPELVELPKFLLSLSRNEKEDDFLVIKGSKLPQRPRKRAKLVEKGLQRLLPGAWLCNLTRERYEVRERKVTRKKPRGLKAMNGNADSDTE